MGILGSFSHQPEPASQDLQDQEEFLGRSPGSGGIPGDISGVRRREKEQIQGWVWRVSNPELCSSRCPILLPSAPIPIFPEIGNSPLEISWWASPNPRKSGISRAGIIPAAPKGFNEPQSETERGLERGRIWGVEGAGMGFRDSGKHQNLGSGSWKLQIPAKEGILVVEMRTFLLARC